MDSIDRGILLERIIVHPIDRIKQSFLVFISSPTIDRGKCILRFFDKKGRQMMCGLFEHRLCYSVTYKYYSTTKELHDVW